MILYHVHCTVLTSLHSALSRFQNKPQLTTSRIQNWSRKYLHYAIISDTLLSAFRPHLFYRPSHHIPTTKSRTEGDAGA